MIEIPPLGDEIRAMGMPLAYSILLAYFPRPFKKERIRGAPQWVWDDGYDFVGKVREADLADWQRLAHNGFGEPNPVLQSMLQAALADRCKLVVHRVPAELDGYALVVANHGPNRKKLVESNPDESIPSAAQHIPLQGKMIPVMSRENPTIQYFQTSMASLARSTAVIWGKPIEDRTGIGGKYDFTLMRWGTDDPTSSLDWASLGLRLIPIKVPAESIVIDHIERPSPN